MKRRCLLGTLGAAWPLAVPGMLQAQPAVAASSRAASNPAASNPITRRALAFPQDFGAHPTARTEWWYLTGWLVASERRYGFQVTFFRSRTDLAAAPGSRFAAGQLLFAHAALTDLQGRRQRHDQRIARAGFGIAEAAEGDTHVTLRDWSLQRQGAVAQTRYLARLASDDAGFAFNLTLATTQPVLPQGDAGYSRKGPREDQASHYYSQPQLAATGTLTVDGRALTVAGRAWMDHEWSETLLDRHAVGWDWIGMNLDDGSALTAFRLRRTDGSALYAGGSLRVPGGEVRSFQPGEVRFTAGQTWLSPASQARYPLEWTVETPAGRHTVRALLDAQELDSRGSTGTFYWEGLSDLLDAQGRRVGGGYLEMTGYAGRLTL